jgi:hypothetical protein
MWLLSAFSPRFNDNLVIRTASVDGQRHVVSVPYFCTNRTDGCISVHAVDSGQVLYSFEAARISGCVFIGTSDADVVVKIPTGIGFGFSPLIRIGATSADPDYYVKVYRRGMLADSIRIPALSPVEANRQFFFTGKKLDRSKLLQRRGDTLGIVTHRGVVLLSCRAGEPLMTTFTADFARLASFEPVLPQAQQVCLPYPQPLNCAQVPALPNPPQNRSRRASH